MASSKTSMQLQGEFISVVFYSLSVSFDFTVGLAFFVLVPDESVNSILRELWFSWLCYWKNASRSDLLHARYGLIYGAL